MVNNERVIILIPTYNEVGNIGLTLDRLIAINSSWHILVLDDNSPDGTSEVVKKKMVHHHNIMLMQRIKNKGFAQSYLEGFRWAINNNDYELVITMDADFSHDPKEIPAMIRLIKEGCDVVVGSRYAQKRSYKQIKLWRRFLSRFANSYIRMIINLKLTDCTSGFMVMRKRALKILTSDEFNVEGYGLLFQLKQRAFLQQLNVREHAVEWPDRHQGESKMSARRIVESAFLPWRILWGQWFRASINRHDKYEDLSQVLIASDLE